jgi:hypothetical protein
MRSYKELKRMGGHLIERLSTDSLVACATATGRTVQQFLEDNGYVQR